MGAENPTELQAFAAGSSHTDETCPAQHREHYEAMRPHLDYKEQTAANLGVVDLDVTVDGPAHRRVTHGKAPDEEAFVKAANEVYRHETVEGAKQIDKLPETLEEKQALVDQFHPGAGLDASQMVDHEGFKAHLDSKHS